MGSRPNVRQIDCPKERPYKCSLCGQTFKRVDHLRRHANIHTKHQGYQCPCGERSVRKHVFTHHLQTCEIYRHRASSGEETIPQKATRNKRACDKCAGRKTKCDFREPCGRCRERSWTCTYTRDGYLDPYESYRITEDSSLQTLKDGSSKPGIITPAESLAEDISPLNSQVPFIDTPLAACSQNALGHLLGSTIDRVLSPEHMSSEQQVEPAFDFSSINPTEPFELGMTVNPSWTLSSPSWFLEPPGQFELQLDEHDSGIYHQDNTFQQRGFSLEQSDPIEAKCAEMRLLLQRKDPDPLKSLIFHCMTREKILICHQLYGMHFQYHYPILHLPTHKFLDASPKLLLAMVLAGAHYSHSLIPIVEISRFALRLMASIENQKEEVDLEVPELEIVQASAIVLAILACSCDSMSNHAMSIHFPRVLSMVQRLGALEAENVLDSEEFSEETLTWRKWISQESHRRLACSIFSLDMARCIFIGDPPTLSPLSLEISLPNYEAVWEAKTYAEWLNMFKAFPSPSILSNSLKLLRNCDPIDPPLLEISGFGMFTLIKGLHGILFSLTREEVMPLFLGHMTYTTAIRRQCYMDSLDISKSLKNDFSSQNVETIADDFIEKYGGQASKSLNSALNAWRRIWERREFSEDTSDGKTFSCDPLPFWFLAKVFLLLHLIRGVITNDKVLAIPRGNSTDHRGRAQAQTKLNLWLQRFRPQTDNQFRSGDPENDGSYLMPQEGSRVLLLMEPL